MSHNNGGCGSGSCGCAERAAKEPLQNISFAPPVSDGLPPASVNGVPLYQTGERPDDVTLRQLACQELLRQAAVAAGLLGADNRDAAAVQAAIELHLDQVLEVPEPDEATCQRHYAAHGERYRAGERVRARHILFAVTPGVDVTALRKKAESVFLDVRCHDGSGADKFAVLAREYSNCPSGSSGGDLDWLTPDECAPEFARELFGHAEIGVLPRLVHSRFGLHVVEVLAREPGSLLPYATVRGAVATSLRQHVFATALRQYLTILAGQAALRGVALEGAASPLVQ